MSNALNHLKAIIFDFGGVFDRQHETLQGFAASAARLGLAPEALYATLYGGAAWAEAKVGRINHRQFLERVMRDIDPTAHDVDAFHAALFAGRQLDAAVIAVARQLARRYPLALLSNHTDELEALLDAHDLRTLFAVIINSAKVGVAKPDARAYQLALDGLGIQPHQALFIDDKPRNIVAAQALGIPSLLYSDAPRLLADLRMAGVLDNLIDQGDPYEQGTAGSV